MLRKIGTGLLVAATVTVIAVAAAATAWFLIDLAWSW